MQVHEKLRAARRLKRKMDRLRRLLGGAVAMAGIALLTADPTLMSISAYIATGLAAFALMIAGATLAGAWVGGKSRC